MWLPKDRCIRQKRGAVTTSRPVTLIFAQYVQECWGTLRWFDHQDIAAEVPSLPPLAGQTTELSCAPNHLLDIYYQLHPLYCYQWTLCAGGGTAPPNANCSTGKSEHQQIKGRSCGG